MTITYSGNIIADVRSEGVLLEQGVGQYLLRFKLVFDLRAWPNEKYVFRNASAKVYVGLSQASARPVGLALPESPVMIMTSPHSYSQQCVFDLPVFPGQLAELERIRNGADLQFRLQLCGESHGSHHPMTTRSDVWVSVNQSEWIRLLKAANYVEILIFEIPIPRFSTAGSQASVAAAADHLQRARDLFLAGHYEETVGKCRLSLEAITKALAEEQQQSEAVATFTQRRRDMSAKERLLLLREAARHYTHPAHHDVNGVPASAYSRTDAMTILGITAALLIHAGQAATSGPTSEPS